MRKVLELLTVYIEKYFLFVYCQDAIVRIVSNGSQ